MLDDVLMETTFIWYLKIFQKPSMQYCELSVWRKTRIDDQERVLSCVGALPNLKKKWTQSRHQSEIYFVNKWHLSLGLLLLFSIKTKKRTTKKNNVLISVGFKDVAPETRPWLIWIHCFHFMQFWGKFAPCTILTWFTTYLDLCAR